MRPRAERSQGRLRLVGAALLVGSLSAGPVSAGQASPSSRLGSAGARTDQSAAIDGPPAPAAPAVVSRDETGRATVRAIALIEPLRLDGSLDEAVYDTVPGISDFIQQVPTEGAVATERTEAWVMFDSSTIYVSARCWDTAPSERWVANELRRDTNQLRQNDTFGVIFDTFYDRRNGYLFYTNPLGARADQAVTDEGTLNVDWNPVWDVRTGRFPGGWTVEMAIPFKSLRYRSGAAQVWGINIRRVIRRKNEWTHLTLVPASAGVPGGMFRLSMAGTLVGLDLPSANRNVEIKPFVIGGSTTDRARAISNDGDGNIGGDVKYGLNANLTADLTIHTDFAQVEVDEQQVNLTRFAISYPEKRDFFLEGRGLFDFGRGGTTTASSVNSGVTPTLFYSRRIGLNRGQVIPIEVGGRVTGKVGKVGLGLMNMETGDETISATPATNFTVMRVKRDILRRSSIGAIFTNRSQSTVASGGNQAYGADATFSFFQNLAFGGYYARTTTPSLKGDEDSYQARFDFVPDRYGARFEYLKVGDNFNPEVGLVRRDNFKRTFGSLRFSPRPKTIKSVRKFTWEASLEHFKNGAGQTETQILDGKFNTEFQRSDQFAIEATRNYELLLRPFSIATGVTIPPGGYEFSDAQVSYSFGQQRRVSGTASVQLGEFYDGTIAGVTVSGARMAIAKQFSVEPSLSFNQVKLPYGDFTTRLMRARTDYAFSPRMFASALVQYNSTDRTFGSNVRFRWEYSPGSELFLVYTDERDTVVRGFPDLKNRAFVVKVNRLFRF